MIKNCGIVLALALGLFALYCFGPPRPPVVAQSTTAHYTWCLAELKDQHRAFASNVFTETSDDVADNRPNHAWRTFVKSQYGEGVRSLGCRPYRDSREETVKVRSEILDGERAMGNEVVETGWSY